MTGNHGGRKKPYRLTTAFDTDYPALQVLLTQVQNEKDPIVKLEVEAVLHHWAAADCIRKAERLRAEEVAS
jgi:hypothetical protein